MSKNKRTSKERSTVIPGLIGLVALITVIIGFAVLVIRYENQARVDAEMTETTQSTSAPTEQCYTMTESMIFSTGNPKKDATMAKVVTDHADTPELKEFLAFYAENKKIDESSSLWQEAWTATPDTVDLKPYLRINPSGVITVNDDGDPKNYVEARLPYPENIPTDFNYVQVALVDTDKQQISNEVRTYIIATNSGDDRYTLVFPVEKSENDNLDNVVAQQVVPVC